MRIKLKRLRIKLEAFREKCMEQVARIIGLLSINDEWIIDKMPFYENK